MNDRKRIRAAVVGLGYWGPNLVRNLHASGEFEVAALCDENQKRLDKFGDLYPWAKRFTSATEMLQQDPPELLVVATPVKTHRALTLAGLEVGSNVLCEKPLASSVAEASEMLELAAKMGKRIFVDHTFVYTGAVRRIKKDIAAGALGNLFYIDSVRINLGLFQPDVDVIWDLAPHDLSTLEYVLGTRVKTVQAIATSNNPRGFADVAYLHLEFETGLAAHLHLSWLSPVKVRRMIFSGSKSSLIYDDLEASEKIKVYDHGVSFDVSDIEQRKQVLVSYRRGDMHAPAIDTTEALATELKDIAAALRGAKNDAATGEDGLAIVRTLEAAQKSLAAGGTKVSTTP
jgi:predicted dehydrogenase